MRSYFLSLLLSLCALSTNAQDGLVHYSVLQLDSVLNLHLKSADVDILPYAQAGLDKAAKERGKQDPLYARMLYFKAYHYYKINDPATAIPLLQQAIAIQKIKIPTAIEYAESLDCLAGLYWDIGDYKNAASFYEQTLVVEKELLDKKNYVRTMSHLAAVTGDMGDFVKAENLYKEIEKACKDAGIENTLVYANSLNSYGMLNVDLGRFDEAEKIYKKGIGIYESIYTKDCKESAQTVDNLAILYTMKGDYKNAEILFVKSMNIKKIHFGVKDVKYGRSLNNLAILHKNLGRYEIAEKMYKEALEVYRAALGNKHPECSKTLENLANLYYLLGNYEAAEPLYKESISIRKESLGEAHPDYAKSLGNLGNLYDMMGHYEDAEKLYLEALQIYKNALGEKHAQYGSCLGDLAIVYQNMGRIELAEKLHRQTIKIVKETLGNKHPNYAKGLHNLAMMYQNIPNQTISQYKAAEELEKEALAVQKELTGEKHPEYLMFLNSLAGLYNKMEQYPQSWELSQQSIFLNTNLMLSTTVSEAWADSLANATFISGAELELILKNIYFLLDANSTENKTKQSIIAELALKILKKNRDDFSASGDKLRSLTQSYRWTLWGLEVLDKNTQVEKAFAFAEQSKSVLLMDAAKAERAYNMGDLPDSLMQEEENLIAEKDKIQVHLLEKLLQTEKDSLLFVLNNLNIKIKDFKKKIEKNYPKYAALKYEHNDASVKDVQALLDDKTALLEYVIGDSSVYIFYINKKQIKLLEYFVSNEILTEKIKALHQALSDYKFINQTNSAPYQQYTENAFWFYQNLVAPALKNAKHIKNLMIVSDGELGHLPFEAFLVEQAPQSKTSYNQLHYLVQDYKISYNYSATFWKENKTNKKNKNNGQLLAMVSNYQAIADSANANRLPAYQRLRKDLIPLPQARKEVEELAKGFQGFFGFDNQSSEKIFKEKAADFAIIHLAMHGLLDNKAPILSSLAFTEDRDSVENNFLQAFEISKMKLNADLVVLSACETGYGKFEKGNGIASLARAFMYAGASALVVSLWQVNDFATSKLMKNFYDNLTAGMSKDEALQQAKLEYLKQAQGIAAHPAFWSAFILIGDESPVQISSKNGSLWWWLAGLGILILIGGIFIIGRKKIPQ